MTPPMRLPGCPCPFCRDGVGLEHQGVMANQNPPERARTVTIQIPRIDPDLFALMLGSDPATWPATDEDKIAAGWTRIPADDPDYHEQYAAWRLP